MEGGLAVLWAAGRFDWYLGHVGGSSSTLVAGGLAQKPNTQKNADDKNETTMEPGGIESSEAVDGRTTMPRAEAST